MNSIKTYILNIEPKLLQHLNGKMGQLIHAVQNHDFVSEEALIRHVCGEKRERKYYLNLKSRTLKMLQALAIVSASKGASETKKKLDICRKKILLGKKFIGNGDKEEGLRLVKQAHRIALSYDFVYMACELASILFRHHAYSQRNSNKANEYAAQVERYSDAYKAEKKAEYYYFQAIGQINGTFPAEKLKRVVEQTALLSGESLKCYTYHSMLNVLYGFRIADYQLIIKCSEQTLNYFETKKGVLKSHYLFFLTNKGITQIATEKYKEAEQTFFEAEQYIHAKSINEYIIALYKTINALHSGNYQLAYQLFRQNRRCKFENIRQQFAIIEAYLCFLAQMGYLQLNHTFRLGKYLNETIKAQADKQESNINILIAELLIYLVRNRGKFIDRIEAANNYSYRHLKGPATKRAKRFIKILCLLPRANFKPSTLKRIASNPIQFLNENPIHVGNNIAIEIIPFEALLKMILQQLERKVA